MVLGKAGLRLEAWKFSVYLIIPIGASMYFNDPDRQKYWADYFQFLTYPPNATTNLKEELEEYKRKYDEEKAQRDAYMEQMRQLQESAKKSRENAALAAKEGTDGNAGGKKKGWLW